MVQELASSPVVFIARKAVERNCAWLCPTPNAPMTCGIATFVMEPVKIEVKNADRAAAVASHRAPVENVVGTGEAVTLVKGEAWLR